MRLRKWEDSLEESEIFSWKKIKVNKHVEGVMARRDGGDSRIFEGGFSPWRKRTGGRGWRATSAVWIFLYRAEGHRRGDQRSFFFGFERRRLGQKGNERKKLREGDKQGKGEQNREKTKAARKEKRKGVFWVWSRGRQCMEKVR